jgi:Ca-activated chloride channel family protein
MVSITFENPEYLWFLFAIPFLIVTHFFLLRHTKRKAMKFANFVALKRITGERFITKNYTILIIRLLIITAAILAVSQTVIWYEGTTNENEYVIAIDTSASMTTEDIPPTRVEAAKIYAKEFVDSLDSNTRVGIISFSGITFIEEPLTLKRGDLHNSLDRLDASAAGTDIPGAVITATNVLASSERGRAIILLTDGSNTIETFASRGLQRAAGYANVHRVKIYTIGIGTDTQVPIGYLPQYYNVSATYNADNLLYLSNETGGQHYQASNPEELSAAYKDIRASDKTSTLRMDLTGGLMLICLMLIMIEWGLLNTRFRMLP